MRVASILLLLVFVVGMLLGTALEFLNIFIAKVKIDTAVVAAANSAIILAADDDEFGGITYAEAALQQTGSSRFEALFETSLLLALEPISDGSGSSQVITNPTVVGLTPIKNAEGEVTSYEVSVAAEYVYSQPVVVSAYRSGLLDSLKFEVSRTVEMRHIN